MDCSRVWTSACALLLGVLAPLQASAAPEGRGTTILVIDTSASMQKDGRAEAARLAASLFVQMVAPLGPVGVVAFGETARVVSEPRELTSAQDVGAVVRQLDRLAFDGKWTEYRAGLETALKLLEGSESGGRILFMTDGDIDPDPADPFQQTDVLKAELAKKPRCAENQTVRKAAYGSYPPHGECEPVYKVIADQSIAYVEDKILPALKAKGVQLNAVALQVAGGQSYSLLRGWSAQTGGQLFRADAPRDLPRLFAEAFARSTASIVAPVKGTFEVEPRLKSLQLVAASSGPVSVSVASPEGPLECAAKGLADCFDGEGLEPRGSVVRVASPPPGRWTVKVSGKGASAAQVLAVKRYDLTARFSVMGKPSKEVQYLDDADVRVVQIEVLSGAGEALPADAPFLRGLGATLHQPARDVHAAMKATGPATFEVEVKPPPAVIPPKRLLKAQEPARRETEPVVGEVLFGGAVIARIQANLVPLSLSLAPEKPVFTYQGIGKPFPVAVAAKMPDGTAMDVGRIAGASVEVREGKEVIGSLACAADERCSGELTRTGRSRDAEVFDLTLVRNNVVLGSGKLTAKLEWGWLDYFMRYGLPAIVAIALLTFLAGKYLPDRIPAGTKVVSTRQGGEEWSRTLDPKNPLFRASTAKVNLSSATEGFAGGYLTVKAEDRRVVFDNPEGALKKSDTDTTVTSLSRTEIEVRSGGKLWNIQIRKKT